MHLGQRQLPSLDYRKDVKRMAFVSDLASDDAAPLDVGAEVSRGPFFGHSDFRRLHSTSTNNRSAIGAMRYFASSLSLL